MSNDLNCPFCDALEERISARASSTWEDIAKIVSNYFSNFTYGHFRNVCDSCFTYIQEFCKSRKLWLINEAQIHKKRMLGQFKGLKDIVNLKKNSFLICRLCFKGSPSEEVIFVYHENKIYQPGYIQKMLHLHANNIDLSMTENPVICQECLDRIQTFDALYQMCLENQAGKLKPDLKVISSSDVQHSGSLENETEKIVHVQLKKSSNNSLVLHPVTEAESAVNSLMRSRETPGNSVILNGWTTKKVIDMVKNPKSNNNKKTKNQDVCVISDEDELECNTPSTKTTESDNNETAHKKPEPNTGITEDEDSTSSLFLRKLLEKPKNIESDIPASKSDIIEIDDSDEEEAIVIPSILNIATVSESEETMEMQPHNDPGDVEDGQDIEAIPTVEINMAAVDRLFSNNETESELEPILREYSSTETDIDGSEITSVDESSNSNNSHILKMESKDTLEEDLSDFLQFNKESGFNTNSDSLKRSNESLNNDETCKKFRSETAFEKCDLKTYSSAYEQFLMNKSDPGQTAWKLLRGDLMNVPKNDDYCSWFPFYAHTTKFSPSNKRKCYMIALENQYGSRIYRCNVCLQVVDKESLARYHDCRNFRGRRRLICPIPKCSFYTYNEYLLSQHKKAHTLLSIDAIQDYKCSFCEFYSSDKKCMENHNKALHGKGAVQITISKCKFCFFESPNPDILAHHITVRHSYKKTKFTKKHFS